METTPGQALPRLEDYRFLIGKGCYVDDIAVPHAAVAVFLRGVHAHAKLEHIEARAAAALPGVLGIFTAEHIKADGLGDIPCLVPVRGEDGRAMPRPARPILARNYVRFVGEPIAMIVAETTASALSALEQVVVSYYPLPAIIGFDAALAPGGPRVWDEIGSNIAFCWQRGNENAVSEALSQAAHVIRLTLVNNRVIPCPLEPRATLGVYDEKGHYTLYTSSQGAHAIRDALSQSTLKVPRSQIRVIVPDVGGGFGSKIFHYPEEVLVLWAARHLGRPVRWQGDRTEACSADTHGRDQRNSIIAGFDAEGRCLALHVDTLANMGAYLNAYGPALPTQATGSMLSGPYAIPTIFATCRGVYTNTVPVDAYRGAGRPEATYLLERLMDTAARQLGIAPDEIRRRNFVRPDEMPYKSAVGPTYDAGNFDETLTLALEKSDWAGFQARRAEAAARGKLRGIGLSSYVEICAFESEAAQILFPEDNVVEIRIGTQSTGQGHATAYAQLAAAHLGVPITAIRVIQGDTDLIAAGKGTSGSRSLVVGGSAILAACEAVIRRGHRFAAHLLQVDETRISFAGGAFVVAGVDRIVSLFELVKAARDPENLPDGEGNISLGASAEFSLKAPTFPYGSHVAEIEIDPGTGEAAIIRYNAIDDFGLVVNPLLVAGQVQGGVAQGIGQALMELAAYDPASGQLISASLLDYALPHAADIPTIETSFTRVACTTNPLGSKGSGEAGAIAACPAVINAILDALAPLGVSDIDMPASPERIWRALRNATQMPA